MGIGFRGKRGPVSGMQGRGECRERKGNSKREREREKGRGCLPLDTLSSGPHSVGAPPLAMPDDGTRPILLFPQVDG